MGQRIPEKEGKENEESAVRLARPPAIDKNHEGKYNAGVPCEGGKGAEILQRTEGL